MDPSINKGGQVENFSAEQQPDYEKAELDLLRQALSRTYTERFLFATRLYKIQ